MHFLIGRLRKVVVPSPDSHEWLRSLDTDDVIYKLAEFFTGLPRRDRDGDHDPPRLHLLQGGDGGAHAGAGRQAIVNQDDGPTINVGRRPVAPVEAFATFELLLFAGSYLVDHFFWDLQDTHDFLVEHADATAGQGAHRQFFLAGQAELADQENVERSLEP